MVPITNGKHVIVCAAEEESRVLMENYLALYQIRHWLVVDLLCQLSAITVNLSGKSAKLKQQEHYWELGAGKPARQHNGKCVGSGNSSLDSI